MLQIAVSSLTYEGFKPSDYRYLFENAYADGYRNIEFNCWYADSLSPDRIQYLKKQCYLLGYNPIALHVSAFGGNTSEEISWNASHKMRAIQAAVELGCQRVVASASAECRSKGAIIEELNCISAYAENMGIYVSIENHCNNIVAVSEDVLNILNAVPSRNIGACLDGGHLEAAGESIERYIEKVGSRIIHLHLKENKIFGQKSFCRFSSGGTDNGQMIQLMKSRGYQGYMSVELSPEIGETGDSIVFSNSDRSKAVELYSVYEDK